MVIRHCFPYNVILDAEKKAIAFRNRNYYFLHGFFEDEDNFWFEINAKSFDALLKYLLKNGEKNKDANDKRFTVFYLYNDGNAPMNGLRGYNRYRKIIDGMCDMIGSPKLYALLREGDRGFDFGKMSDGTYIPLSKSETTTNVYEMARQEVSRLTNRI